jgi:ankyrin repeat protein
MVRYSSDFFTYINKNKLELFLNKHKNINYLDETDSFLIINATYYCKLKMLKFILTYNPNINVRDKKGNTALMIAINKNSYKKTKLLIKYGANINLNYNYWYHSYPLISAIINDNYKITKLLFQNNVNFNVIHDNKNCLHYALIHGNKKIIKLLLKYDIILDYKTYNSYLFFAYSYSLLCRSKIKLAKLLINKFKSNLKLTINNYKLLHINPIFLNNCYYYDLKINNIIYGYY